MAGFGDLAPTGRTVAASCSDLVELKSAEGLLHTAVVYRPEFRDHPDLGGDLDPILGVMERPGVVGVAQLVRADRGAGSYVYASGTAWTAQEMIRELLQAGKTGSVRAGLELCYLGAEVLLDAADIAGVVGVQCHGSLDPSRVMIKGDGQVVVVGYGLPPLDIRVWREDSRRKPSVDALRYAPPERFSDAAEDLSSDLFSLTLIGLELMMGRPVYDGLFEDISELARRGEAVRKIYQWRDIIPSSVSEVLVKALKPDLDSRYRDGVEYLHAVHDLLSSVDAEGAPLVEVISQFRGLSSRGKLSDVAATGQYSAEHLAELTADLQARQAAGIAPPSRARADDDAEEPTEPVVEAPRWASRAKVAAPEPAPKPEGKNRASALRDRLRASRSRRDAPADPAPNPRDRLRRRLRRKDEEESPAKEEEPRRPRRLRGRSKEKAPSITVDVVAPEEDLPTQGPITLAPTEPDLPVAAPPDPPNTPAVVKEPPAVVAASARSAAAALLERLRGGGGVSAPPIVPVIQAIPESTTAQPAPVDEPAAPVERERLGSSSGASFTVEGPSGRQCELDVDLDAPLAVVCGLAMARLGLIRTDLTGRLEGWARITQSGKAWPGSEVGHVLDPDRPITLTWVDNDVTLREVHVKVGGTLTRFRAPMGTAIPVGWVLGHLRTWLQLPVGDWQISCSGRTLHPDEILADAGEGLLEVSL